MEAQPWLRHTRNVPPSFSAGAIFLLPTFSRVCSHPAVGSPSTAGGEGLALPKEGFSHGSAELLEETPVPWSKKEPLGLIQGVHF